MSFESSSWADIEALRKGLAETKHPCLEDAAQAFVRELTRRFPATLLARVFIVLPLSKLPPDDRRFAAALVKNDRALDERTPVLSLLGTAGRKPEWCDRKLSKGHLAIPLLGASFVQGIPMIAKLLADLDVGLAGLDEGKTLDTRRLLGGRNGAFFVADARSSLDADGRSIIPSKDFVAAHSVRTVFGMGGAYVDGTLAVTVVFTSETIDRLIVDRFPSLISNFKMTTSALLTAGLVYREASGANGASGAPARR